LFSWFWRLPFTVKVSSTLNRIKIVAEAETSWHQLNLHQLNSYQLKTGLRLLSLSIFSLNPKPKAEFYIFVSALNRSQIKASDPANDLLNP